jgi:hypothetical protein
VSSTPPGAVSRIRSSTSPAYAHHSTTGPVSPLVSPSTAPSRNQSGFGPNVAMNTVTTKLFMLSVGTVFLSV